MSIADLLSPLSIGKTYMDINVNAINVGPGGASFQGAITGPLLISENSASSVPIVLVNELNPAASNVNVAIAGVNQTSTQTISLITVNEPTPIARLYSTGLGNLELSTNQASSSISINPFQTPALKCNYDSVGMTNTQIQNLSLPTIGGTPTFLNYYEEFGPLAMTFSGPWGVPYTRNVFMTGLGDTVTMRIDALEQIPTTPTMADINTSGNTIPARYLPTAAADEVALVYITIPVFDNNSSRLGTLRITSTGALIITSSQDAAPVFSEFSATVGTKVGFPTLFFSYSLSS